MTSKELEEILKSPITKAAKGRFISIEQLEQIKIILEAWEICKNKKADIHDIIYCSNAEIYNCGLFEEYCLTQEEFETLKKALEVKDETS